MKKNFFTFLPVENGNTNWFDLSHTNSGSCNMGGLYPILVEPTLPGDYFKCDISYLLRMAQMVAPPMSRVGTAFFAFYCPNRILMDSKEWDKFLADVDGTSGVSLPTLSFAPIFGHIKESIDYDKVLSFMNRYLSPLSFKLIYNNMYEVYYKGSLIQAEQVLQEFMDESDWITMRDRLYDFNDQFDYGDFESATPLNLVQELLRYYHQYPFKGTLLDYMGFPVNSPLMDVNGFVSARRVSSPDEEDVVQLYESDKLSPTRSFQVLPLIAYMRIWNEYFRQEFIQEEIDSAIVDDFNAWTQALSTDISILWKIKRRDWEHDYFTSCLPAPQLGESSSIEIGADGKFTIPELREANVIQRIREKLLHGGTRIWEIVANFFSERVSDSRIQIPEYIRPTRGGFSWLRMSDIYQTAPGASDSFPTLDASANIAAPRGASVNTNNNGISFNFKAEEHGYLIVLMNIQPEPVYCQGIPRHFLSLDTLDYGWPDFANITEQPVYQYEVYATDYNTRVVSGDYPIFGWQSQYAWYKFHQSELHGELRDDLDFFTFARIFEGEPHLNDEFLQCNPADRPFPISYEYDKLTYHLAIDLRVNRRLPYFGIPSLR